VDKSATYLTYALHCYINYTHLYMLVY